MRIRTGNSVLIRKKEWNKMLFDSPVMNALNKAVNLVILNLCFLLCCVPVVTAGAGLAALYSVNLKMARNEEAYIFRSYWKAFGENVKQATLCWLMVLACGAVCLWNLRVIPQLPGWTRPALYAGTFVCGAVCMIEFLYVFPYLARFRDRLRVCLKNALLIGGSRPGYTGTMILVGAAFLAFGIVSIEAPQLLFFWLTIGFALWGYVQAWILRKVFDRYEEPGR